MPAPILRLLSAAVETADADLLGRFLANRDEPAFAELVRRHGPSVWRVCRRLVGSSTADDAFQATFLILACRAESVRKAASVGSWLVGVAGRVARQMRKRDRRYFSACPEREIAGSPASGLTELAAILDDELTRLPEHLRDPVVLCLMHGRTQEQAAAELGGSVRTIRRRLDRAKAVLRLRLERRGVVPAVAAGLIAGVSAPVLALTPELPQQTVRGVLEFLAGGAPTPAAILAKGVVMGTVKLKFGGLLSGAAVVVFGLGWGLAGQTPAEDPIKAPSDLPKALDKPVAAAPPAINGKNSTSVYPSANFLVSAPTLTQARVIAAEAEHHRGYIAVRWLGRSLPHGRNEPIRIHFTARPGATGGASTFRFGVPPKGGAEIMLSSEVEVKGDFLEVLTTTLPHEITHTVLAEHFGRPLPRWADEGIAILSEPASELASHDIAVRKVLAEGRAIRLKHLFKMSEYPKDTLVVFAQGHSVVRFLLAWPGRGGLPVLSGIPYLDEAFKVGPEDHHQRLLMFLSLGIGDNTIASWDKAAKAAYGFDSVDSLEAAWIEWLKKQESKLNGKPTPTLTPPKEEKPDLIPPTKLPGR